MRKDSIILSLNQIKNSTNINNNNINEPKTFDENINATTNPTYQLEDQNEDDAKESDYLIARNEFHRLSIIEKKSNDENRSLDTQSLFNESITDELKHLNMDDLLTISIQVEHFNHLRKRFNSKSIVFFF